MALNEVRPHTSDDIGGMKCLVVSEFVDLCHMSSFRDCYAALSGGFTVNAVARDDSNDRPFIGVISPPLYSSSCLR